MKTNADHNLIRRICAEVEHLKGDAAEIGVYQGESAKLICELLPQSMVYLFDTFSGIPAELCVAGVDSSRGGEFRDTSLSHVQAHLEGCGNSNVIQGEFSQSCQGLDPPLRFVHIDCDIYRTTLAAMEWAWPLLVPGGVILDDDYDCGSCMGAKKAIREFAKSHSDVVTEVENHRAIIRRRTDAH